MALPNVTFFALSFERKKFSKNHKFSLKNLFFWKRDEFERGLSEAVGRDYAHSKELDSLYQNRLMRQVGIGWNESNSRKKNAS